MMRVRRSKLKLLTVVSGKGSRMNVTESSATARFVFASVSSVGGTVLLGAMVKPGSEMLKKMLPMASTLTRAVEVGVFGTLIMAVPLFGVLAARVNGKLFPPSIESNTRTFAQLTGALEVLATFHV